MGFGGVGDSGSGRYGGFEGYKNFCNRKGGMIKAAQPKAIRDLTLPPFTDGKCSMIDKVFLYSSLYNQSDVAYFGRVVMVSVTLTLAWYFFM